MADPVWQDNVTPLNAVNMNKLQTRDEKAAANGYPSLDGTGKVPLAQLPAMGGGGGADLTYEGDFVPATSYQDGDIVVKDGIAYLCVGGPTTVAPDPVPWGAARPTKESELGYGELLAPVTCPATTEAAATLVVSTPAIALDGQTTIVIDAYIPVVWFSDTPDAVGFLFEDSTSLGAVWGYSASKVTVGTNHGFIRVSRRLTPAAGSHTYSFRARVSSGAGVQMIGGPGGPNQYTPGYIRVSAVSSPIPIIPGASLPVSYGTTLPASPVDGQEAILVDSLTNPTYQWRFRFNANSTSAYKWEYIGGTRLGVEGLGLTTGSAAYVDVGGSLLTLPRSGDYLAEYGGDFFATAAGTYGQMTIKRGAAVASDNDSVADSSPQASTASNSHGRITRVNGLTAGDVIRLQMKSNQATTATMRYGFLFLTPVRVQ